MKVLQVVAVARPAPRNKNTENLSGFMNYSMGNLNLHGLMARVDAAFEK